MTAPRHQQPSLLMMINTAMTGAVLLYVVNTEHRITALETKVMVVAELHAAETTARRIESRLTNGNQKP